VKLVMQGDGNLVLYRTQNSQPLWASNTAGQPVVTAEMQGDGNFVAYTSAGAAPWATGTDGNPGASVVVQDDGNLVVYNASNNPLWASNTVINWNTPAIGHKDARGYSYVSVSESWKDLCAMLPCFAALQWPGYSTDFFDDEIDGQPVVIQLWKGWCQKFLGLQFLPGGIGAEVGVYRRIPGKLKPTSLSFLQNPVLEGFFLNLLAPVADNELWWPAPELNAKLEFTLINPNTNQTFFSAGPENSYWLTSWMNEPDYVKYVLDQGFRTPFFANDYILEYTINGKVRRWPAIGTATRSAYGSHVGATVRSADHLDVFVSDVGGTVRTAAWQPAFTDGWHGWWQIGNIQTPFGAPVHGVSRSTDKLDVFATDGAGVIRTAAWEPAFADGWHGRWSINGGTAAPGATVTAVSRSTDKLDVFVVGTDARVWTAAWEPSFADGWHGWWPVSNIQVPFGRPVYGVSRSQDKLDIFATDTAGVVRTAAWEPAFADGWHGWWEVAGGRALPGSPVTAVSRGPDKLDIFVVGTDGRVWTAAWEPAFVDGWHGWWAIGNIQVPIGSPVHAVSRGPDKLDIFVTDVAGVIRTAAWEPAFADGWHGWWEIAGGRAAPGAAVTAVSRSTDKLDVFLVGTDGRIWSAAWEPAFADGWHGWWPIGG
jgi:hypothetical protein